MRVSKVSWRACVYLESQDGCDGDQHVPFPIWGPDNNTAEAGSSLWEGRKDRCPAVQQVAGLECGCLTLTKRENAEVHSLGVPRSLVSRYKTACRVQKEQKARVW